MRSSLSLPNHTSPCRVTQTDALACATFPAASLALAISSTWPGSSSVASHNTKPCASLVPLQSCAEVLVSRWLSYA